MIVPVWIVMAFLFCLGASVGSFLNVVAYRVPLDMSVVRPGESVSAVQAFDQVV